MASDKRQRRERGRRGRDKKGRPEGVIDEQGRMEAQGRRGGAGGVGVGVVSIISIRRAVASIVMAVVKAKLLERA